MPCGPFKLRNELKVRRREAAGEHDPYFGRTRGAWKEHRAGKDKRSPNAGICSHSAPLHCDQCALSRGVAQRCGERRAERVRSTASLCSLRYRASWRGIQTIRLLEERQQAVDVIWLFRKALRIPLTVCC